MKTRIAAFIAIAGGAVAIVAAVMLGYGYLNNIEVPDDSSLTDARPVKEASPASSPVPAVEPTNTVPYALGQPHMLTEADIPADFDAGQRAGALTQIRSLELMDACMSDAGFAEWTYGLAYWAPDYVYEERPVQWLDFLTPERAAEGAIAEFGTSAATAADYRWEDAGCTGRVAHETGAGN